jgi:hypothetical protein
MYKRSLFAAFIVCALAAPAMADSPVGHYAIEGRNMGKGGYIGTVDVIQTGDTYKVTWVIKGTVYDGTAIGDRNFLAVTYKSGKDNTGLALYTAKGSDWVGVWTYSGGTAISSENWSRE